MQPVAPPPELEKVKRTDRGRNTPRHRAGRMGTVVCFCGALTSSGWTQSGEHTDQLWGMCWWPTLGCLSWGVTQSEGWRETGKVRTQAGVCLIWPSSSSCPILFTCLNYLKGALCAPMYEAREGVGKVEKGGCHWYASFLGDDIQAKGDQKAHKTSTTGSSVVFHIQSRHALQALARSLSVPLAANLWCWKTDAQTLCQETLRRLRMQP